MESPKEPIDNQLLKFVITLEEQSGWNPTRSDMDRLIYNIEHPSRHDRDEMIKFNKAMDKSYREHIR